MSHRTPPAPPQCSMVSDECVQGAGGPSDMTVVRFIPLLVSLAPDSGVLWQL